ncbi:MAG TPA: RDD family protein [Solirubrobacteraceae bacterium]|nr:RDD family protein [Solirubrobacteraceae bacterium]
MSEVGPPGLKVASLWRRLGAAAIDTVVFVPPALVVFAGGGALYVLWRRRGEHEPDDWPVFKPSSRWNLVIWSATTAARVPSRNWRTPGYRALGLRRVDVRTGGPLSARNVLVQAIVAMASGELRRQLMHPWVMRKKRRLEALQPELAQIRRAHPDDPEAQHQALKEFSKRNHVNPAASCAPPLLGSAVMQAPVLWSRLNQTVPERLAGVVVVQD